MTNQFSAKDRVLSLPNLDDAGRGVAERLMNPEGLVLERLFNYLGDLENRLNKIADKLEQTQ